MRFPDAPGDLRVVWGVRQPMQATLPLAEIRRRCVRKFLDACATPLTLLATGAAICLLTSMYFHGAAVVFGPDAENILAPLFYDISRSIHQHGLLAGMYDPGQFAGLSLWDTPYFHPLYPFYFNWLGSDTSIFDTVDRLRVVIFIHLAIYGAGCYLLGRELGVRPWLSVAIGLASPWFPAVQSMLPWPQLLASFAWIPWVLACQIRLYKNPSAYVRSVAILGLAVTFSLLVYAQPAQNMVLMVVGSAAMWAYMAVPVLRTSQQDERRRFLATTFSLSIAAVIALLLCGEYLSGVVTYLGRAIRWVSGGTIIGSQRVPLASFKQYALKVSDLAALMVYRNGDPTTPGNLYVGALVALGAIMAFVARGRDRTVDALFFSAAIAVLFCLSIFAPVIRWIPVANKVRELNWWSCYVAAVLLPLGGYGLQRLLESRGADASGRYFKWPPIWLVAAGFVLTLFLILVSHPGSRTKEALLLGIGFGALMVCLAYPAPTRRFHQLLAVVLVVMSAIVPLSSYGRLSPKGLLLLRPDHVETQDQARRIASNIPDGDEFRFGVSPDISNYKNFTVTLSNLGLRGIRGDESPQSYDKFRLLFFPTPVVADLYGVKYLIVPGPAHDTRDVPIDPKISLRTNPHALPRLFFVQGGVQVVDSPVDALLNAKEDGAWHFFVRLKDLPAGFDLSPYASGDASVYFPEVSRSSTVDTEASIVSHGSGLLVLNEDPAGRWRATIDGKIVNPFRINGFQTAFPVIRAGRHEFVIARPTHLW
jgi:hypothetical protein